MSQYTRNHYGYVTYVCVCTGECQWGDLPLIKKMMTACHSLFPVVRYSFTTIPSFCGGQVGFVLASLNKVRCVFESLSQQLLVEKGGRELVHCTLSQ